MTTSTDPSNSSTTASTTASATASATASTTASTTYYVLRSRTTTMGDGPYVGLAADGAHAVVPDVMQARRFASLAEAESYAGAMGETFGDFELEVRTAA
ncbi:MAG: hypothetical protein H7244_02935 [Herminiimonas sp.]|nr:hypothetical protein [Herminiimonas sp.]